MSERKKSAGSPRRAVLDLERLDERVMPAIGLIVTAPVFEAVMVRIEIVNVPTRLEIPTSGSQANAPVTQRAVQPAQLGGATNGQTAAHTLTTRSDTATFAQVPVTAASIPPSAVANSNTISVPILVPSTPVYGTGPDAIAVPGSVGVRFDDRAAQIVPSGDLRLVPPALIPTSGGASGEIAPAIPEVAPAEIDPSQPAPIPAPMPETPPPAQMPNAEPPPVTPMAVLKVAQPFSISEQAGINEELSTGEKTVGGVAALAGAVLVGDLARPAKRTRTAVRSLRKYLLELMVK